MKHHAIYLILGISVIFTSCTQSELDPAVSDIKLNKNNTLAEELTIPPMAGSAPTTRKSTTSQLPQPTQITQKTPEVAGPQIETPKTMVVDTNKGSISINLYQVAAPKTIQNYIEKSNAGFYNGLTFHRVEDWVVQGGDPKGTGTGGGKIPTELSSIPFKEGSVGVARGQDINMSNDAQFFICTKDCDWLTGQYTIFGQVTKGLEIAKSIEIGDTITSVTLK